VPATDEHLKSVTGRPLPPLFLRRIQSQTQANTHRTDLSDLDHSHLYHYEFYHGEIRGTTEQAFFNDTAPYQGLLLKRVDWRSLPVEAVGNLVDGFKDAQGIAPRIWLEAQDPTQAVHVPLQYGQNSAELQGLIGLSPSEAEVTGLDKLLSSGRWFSSDDRIPIILDQNMARALGVATDGTETIQVWGHSFTVIGTLTEQI